MSWKGEAFKLLGTAVVLFMLASFVSGMLDEKGGFLYCFHTNFLDLCGVLLSLWRCIYEYDLFTKIDIGIHLGILTCTMTITVLSYSSIYYTISTILTTTLSFPLLYPIAPGSGGGGGGLASRLGMGSIVHRAENPDKTFDDVVGIDEAKGDLQEIVMYLRDPKKFTRLGGKLPKGVRYLYSICIVWLCIVYILYSVYYRL